MIEREVRVKKLEPGRNAGEVRVYVDYAARGLTRPTEEAFFVVEEVELAREGIAYGAPLVMQIGRKRP